jgi:hypothetical protein
MESTPMPQEMERELGELRARAYGPAADIDDDPAALARLSELEAERVGSRFVAEEIAHTDAEPNVTAGADAADANAAGADSVGEAAAESPAPRLKGQTGPTATRSARLLLAAGAGAAIVVLGYGVTTLFGPQPDATLDLTASVPDAQARTLTADHVDFYDSDGTTLRSYGMFLGIEPWSTVDADGNPCLILIERSTHSTLDASCTPPEADLLVDLEVLVVPSYDFGDGLAVGSVIRFHLRDESVDVFVIPAPESG